MGPKNVKKNLPKKYAKKDNKENTKKKSEANNSKKIGEASKKNIPDVTDDDLSPQAVKAEGSDDDDLSEYESEYQTEEEYGSSEYDDEKEEKPDEGGNKPKSLFRSSKIGGTDFSNDFENSNRRLDMADEVEDSYFDA